MHIYNLVLSKGGIATFLVKCLQRRWWKLKARWVPWHGWAATHPGAFTFMHSAQLCGPAGPHGVRLPSHHVYASGAEVIVLTSALSQMHSCGGKNFLGRGLLNFQSRLCVTSDGQQLLLVGRQSILSPGMLHVRALMTWELVLFQHFSWAIARALPGLILTLWKFFPFFQSSWWFFFVAFNHILRTWEPPYLLRNGGSSQISQSIANICESFIAMTLTS